VRERRRARDQQDVRRTPQQPGERHLHRRGAEPLRDRFQARGLDPAEAAEREEGDIGDAALCQRVDHRVIAAVDDIVMILDADDRRDPLRLLELREGDVAEAEMAYQALPLELGQRGEAFLDRSFLGSLDAADAQVHRVDRIDAEVAQIVVDAGDQVGRLARRDPGCIAAAHRADLADNGEIVRIGMERFADDPVDDMRPVKVAGVDMVDAARHRGAKHGDRRVAVAGRAEHAGTGELHRAIAHPLHVAVAEPEGAGG
jgi:hypothetical protein